MIKNISIVIVCTVIFSNTLVALGQIESKRKTQYKVIEYPVQYPKQLQDYHNPFEYLDKISIFVGKANNAQKAIDKWAQNVYVLEQKYKDVLKGNGLYGNFCWNEQTPCIEIRHRTREQKYPRNGWYIFTSSTCPPHKGEVDYGEFFLSDEGELMPAMRTSSISDYP